VIFVGNGAGALGPSEKAKRVLTSRGIELAEGTLERGQVGAARNAGLEIALMLGAEQIAFFDDDDHYLPGYLKTIEESSKPFRIVGSRPHHVIDDDGTFATTFPDEGAGPVEWLNGGTLSFEAEIAKRLRFPITPFGEDVIFCRLAKELGFEVWDIGPGHFVYERRSQGEHAWKRDARKHLSAFYRVRPAKFPSGEVPAF
jgi:hypothetical protein